MIKISGVGLVLFSLLLLVRFLRGYGLITQYQVPILDQLLGISWFNKPGKASFLQRLSLLFGGLFTLLLGLAMLLF